MTIAPTATYLLLLVVQMLHLFHHRVAKRHISFAEVISAAVLCVPPFLVSLPGAVFIVGHVGLVVVQIVGSVWIKKLSPSWSRRTWRVHDDADTYKADSGADDVVAIRANTIHPPAPQQRKNDEHTAVGCVHPAEMRGLECWEHAVEEEA